MSGWQIYTYLIISFTMSKHCHSICFLSSFCHFWTWVTKTSIERNLPTCSFSDRGARYLVVLILKSYFSSDCFTLELISATVDNIPPFQDVNTVSGFLLGKEWMYLLNTSDFLHCYCLCWCSYCSWTCSIGRVTRSPNGLKHLLLTVFFFGHMYFLVSLCFLINFI